MRLTTTQVVSCIIIIIALFLQSCVVSFKCVLDFQVGLMYHNKKYKKFQSCVVYFKCVLDFQVVLCIIIFLFFVFFAVFVFRLSMPRRVFMT